MVFVMTLAQHVPMQLCPYNCAAFDRRPHGLTFLISCRASIEQICQNFVLPLAGPPAGDFFNPRQADQLHIQMLSEKLLLNLTLQNVSFKLSTMFISPVRCQNGFRINIELVFDGTHYELLYKQ